MWFIYILAFSHFKAHIAVFYLQFPVNERLLVLIGVGFGYLFFASKLSMASLRLPECRSLATCK